MSRVHVITQGCSANVADSEIMTGILQEKGYEIVGSEEEADAVVFNTCTVKGPTQSFFLSKLNELEKKGKKVIIAGCIPQGSKGKDLAGLAKHSMIGTYSISRISDTVAAALEGRTVSMLEREQGPRLNLPKVRTNPFVEIVPISMGCLGSCSYCKTKHARGLLHSYPVQDIVRHVSAAVKDGAKEVWLTSQDNSAYGKDIGEDMVGLVRAVTQIPRDFKIRIGMANPVFFMDFLDECVDAFMHPKVYKFLHIPLQSGSDDVLQAMRREYCVNDYLRIVRRFRDAIPDVTIATDIICGYPTENDEDAHQTIRALEQSAPDVVNVSRFWPRPGTFAATLPQIPHDIVKRRVQDVHDAHRRIARERSERWIGWSGPVLFTQKGKNDTLVGRNFAYRPVVVRGDDALLGSVAEVRVEDFSAWDLRAVLVR